MKITKDYLCQLIRESLEEGDFTPATLPYEVGQKEASAPIADFREAKMLAVKLGKMLEAKDYQMLKTLLLSGRADYLKSFANAMSVGAAGKK